MEEKKCKHCAMMIPKEAKVCPHCRKNQGTSLGVAILAIVFVFIGIGMCSSLINSPSTNSTTTDNTASISNTNEPVLELEKWGWHIEHGYAIADGRVKNISAKPIDNVVAVMQIYDKQNNFIKADDALIDYRPIMPGQTSPFKVMSSQNPAMSSAFIEFKVFGRGTLPHKDISKNKK